ncbi:MAG: single-stranded-DNA-specific exonuclease RecJ [Castellaniella sp.]
MVEPRLSRRPGNDDARKRLEAAGAHPLLARLWAARGVHHPRETETRWAQMLAPDTLTNAARAAAILADAIDEGQRILVIADYDCDGATACAVAVRALQAMGAHAGFLVPDRFRMGYGLSPAVVAAALEHPGGRPDLLLTVDNGIASVDGVAAANAAGMQVVVTDHHLPGDVLPEAAVIVNPNQPGCGFASRHLAGVGVLFYTMIALRAELRRRGVYAPDGGPRLVDLVDLVALGTVADVVRLDANNRLLVSQGLAAMRAGRMQAGVRALFAVAGREARLASTFDLGFALGPRLNAAGRLADMSIGIRCLLTDDEAEALALARELDQLNRQRRDIEVEMHEQALDSLDDDMQPSGATLCVMHPAWHQGVVGLVASRLKERYWRPALAFAPDEDGLLRGSGRSIPDVHLRDALDLVSKRHPDMILRFGGHAMAAGLSLHADRYEDFCQAFDDAVRELTGKTVFEPVIETDGSLEDGYANAELAQLLQVQIWGAGFPAPVFCDDFQVVHQRLLSNAHLKLQLQRGRQRFDAIWFRHAETLPEFIVAAYRLDANHWNGRVTAQLVIEYARGA